MTKWLRLPPRRRHCSGSAAGSTSLASQARARYRPAPPHALLLKFVSNLLWLSRNWAVPFFLSAAAAGPVQPPGPADCAMYIYADPHQEPTKIMDETSCPTAGGNRAFLVDKGYSKHSFPKLLEVAPLEDHKFICKLRRQCNIVVTGYGLKQDDQLLLLRLEDAGTAASCPPESLAARQRHREQQPVQATRHIRTSSKMAYDHSIRPQTEHTIMTVFDLGQPAEGKYLLCYSTARSVPKQKPQLKDFHYKVGSLGKAATEFQAALGDDFLGLPLPSSSTEPRKNHHAASPTRA